MTMWATDSLPSSMTVYRLRDAFFNLSNYLRDNGNGMEQILNGLIQQAALKTDRFVSDELTNHLFEDFSKGTQVPSALNTHVGQQMMYT